MITNVKDDRHFFEGVAVVVYLLASSPYFLVVILHHGLEFEYCKVSYSNTSWHYAGKFNM